MIEEYDLYEKVGEWFKNNEGCKGDEHSKGYLPKMKMSVDEKPDVVALRYEKTKGNEIPSIDFFGYIVEIRKSKEVINEAIGKIMRYKERCKYYWQEGFHEIRFYIGYVEEGSIPQDIKDVCKNNGIGLLQLHVYDNKVHVNEIIKPEKVCLSWISHRRQHSPGNFEKAVNKSYLAQLIKDPNNMYDKLIREEISKYNEEHSQRKRR